MSQAIHKALISDAQSDNRFDAVPGVPNSLIERTREACSVAFALEVKRNTDITTLRKAARRRNRVSWFSKIRRIISKVKAGIQWL